MIPWYLWCHVLFTMVRRSTDVIGAVYIAQRIRDTWLVVFMYIWKDDGIILLTTLRLH